MVAERVFGEVEKECQIAAQQVVDIAAKDPDPVIFRSTGAVASGLQRLLQQSSSMVQ